MPCRPAITGKRVHLWQQQQTAEGFSWRATRLPCGSREAGSSLLSVQEPVQIHQSKNTTHSAQPRREKADSRWHINTFCPISHLNGRGDGGDLVSIWILLRESSVDGPRGADRTQNKESDCGSQKSDAAFLGTCLV